VQEQEEVTLQTMEKWPSQATNDVRGDENASALRRNLASHIQTSCPE